MNVTAVILTLNEEVHLERCLTSVKGIASDLLVVDCFSEDRTLDIAHQFGARVIQHAWKNYATQFNYALKHIPDDTEWVLRIDADEYLTDELRSEAIAKLPTIEESVNAIFVPRRMAFLGSLIHHGGVFPVHLVRFFRSGKGHCEDRWMDEHIVFEGGATSFKYELIDDNKNNLTWWIDKHNRYANREALDLLNVEYRWFPMESVADLQNKTQSSVKRWLKDHVYQKLPGGIRATSYFLFRYVVCLGFLDGKRGTMFHALQGLWYRYLVDCKIYEVKQALVTGVSPQAAVKSILGIDLAAADHFDKSASK
jgi:glycosyltransferase involved in cell wall biosynthesis